LAELVLIRLIAGLLSEFIRSFGMFMFDPGRPT
jgi:hypothetical protein